MLEQGYITRSQYDDAHRRAAARRATTIRPPRETSKYPYFTTWVRQQVVDKVGAGRAFEGGLRVETTIDAELQDAAQAAVDQWIGSGARPPGRGAGRARQRHQRGAGDGRRRRRGLQRPARSTSPPRASASPGRRSSRSSSRRRSSEGISPTSVWSSRKKDVLRHPPQGQVHRGVRGQQLRGQLRRRRPRWPTPRRSRTTPSTPSSASRSAPRRSRAWPAGWACARRSPPTRR